MSRTLCLGLLSSLSLLAPFHDAVAAPDPQHLELSTGAVLAGDPGVDRHLQVAKGQPFSLYLHAGALSDLTKSYEFGVSIDQAAAVALVAVDASGVVSAYQNSIGTFVGATVDHSAACLQIDGGGPLARIDFVAPSQPGRYSLRLTGSLGESSGPSYVSCAGVEAAWLSDASATIDLAVTEVVAIEADRFGRLKSRFQR